MRILVPWRVRMTEPDDVARYGDRWWTYDEAAILRLPFSELLAIEAEIPVKLKAAIDDNRVSGVMGEMVAVWVAMRMAADPDWPTPPFAEFTPLIFTCEWERVPEEPDPGPLDEAPSSSESTETPE